MINKEITQESLINQDQDKSNDQDKINEVIRQADLNISRLWNPLNKYKRLQLELGNLGRD